MANKREEAREAKRLSRLRAIPWDETRRQHTVRLSGEAWGSVSCNAMAAGMTRSAWIEYLIRENDREFWADVRRRQRQRQRVR